MKPQTVLELTPLREMRAYHMANTEGRASCMETQSRQQREGLHAKDEVSQSPWFLYALRCADDTIYTGVSTDLERRLREHNGGQGARYTSARRPVQLIGA